MLALALLSVLAAKPSKAQLLDQFISPLVPGVAVEPGVTVLSRLRPDYEFQGVHAGSFLIRPRLDEFLGYDDNVLGQAKARGSGLVQTSASVTATSDWARNSVQLSFGVDDFRYITLPNQSFTNWNATLGGTYEIGRDVLSASYSHINVNQTSRDLDTPQLSTPIAFRVDDLRVGYDVKFDRFSIRPEANVAFYSFDDGVVGGIPYPQGFRDRTVVTPGVTFGYEFSPLRSAVLVIRDAVAQYRKPVPGTSTRDYNDVSALAGLDYSTGGLLRFRALAGYESRSFSSSQFKTIQAPIVELTTIYTPTGLTTLTGVLARRIADSADEVTTGFTDNSARLRVDHEYLRNVLINSQAGVFFDQYSRGQGNQTLLTAGAGVTYILNRNARVSGTYDYTQRLSKANGLLGPASGGVSGQQFGSSYSENRYLLKLSVGL